MRPDFPKILHVGVRRNEIDPLEIGLHHAIHRISPGPSDTDQFNDCSVHGELVESIMEEIP